MKIKTNYFIIGSLDRMKIKLKITLLETILSIPVQYTSYISICIILL